MIVAYTKPEVKGTRGGGAIRKSVRSCSFLNRLGEQKSCLFKIFPDLKILVTWCLWFLNSNLFGMARDIAEENMFPPTSSRLAQRSGPYREFYGTFISNFFLSPDSSYTLGPQWLIHSLAHFVHPKWCIELAHKAWPKPHQKSEMADSVSSASCSQKRIIIHTYLHNPSMQGTVRHLSSPHSPWHVQSCLLHVGINEWHSNIATPLARGSIERTLNQILTMGTHP